VDTADPTPTGEKTTPAAEKRTPDAKDADTNERVAETPRRGQAQSAGALLGRALGGLTETVEEVHRAVSKRVESAVPESVRPVSEASGIAAQGIYEIVGESGRVAPIVAAEIYARMSASDELLDTTAGRTVLPAVSGIWGDSIAADHPELAIPMAVRIDGHDLAMAAASLADAFPEATEELVVFIHGLTDSELTWWRSPRGEITTSAHGASKHAVAEDSEGQAPTRANQATMPSYGDRLREDFGYSPIYVRYNTGLRVSDNGQLLSELLAQLTAGWPTKVHKIRLVGHSMGGLVARSACHVGSQSEELWTEKVGSVVTIGTPHHGSPLEKSVNIADWLLSQTPETEPLSRVLRGRSSGVKDLRYGAVVEQDWHGHDPDEFLRDRGTEVPFLDHANYYFMAATITSDPDHPAGRLLGDGLVRYPSASGTATQGRVTFDVDHGKSIGGVNHMSLVNHPAVYAQLSDWLTPD
jgi:pimeloyl-ACP methyl ester carboxylesterase